MRFSSGSFHLGHHRNVTYGKHKYSFFPHSHAILHFCAFGLFSFLLSPPLCLLSKFFNSGSSIHSVLLCERYIYFSAHGQRRTLAILYILIWFSTLFWYILIFRGDFDSYFPFGFQFLAWDHLNVIYCLPCILSMGLLLLLPKIFLVWDERSLEIVFQTFWSWVIS